MNFKVGVRKVRIHNNLRARIARLCVVWAKPSKRAGIIYCHHGEVECLRSGQGCLPFVTSSGISEQCLVQNARQEKRAEMSARAEKFFARLV